MRVRTALILVAFLMLAGCHSFFGGGPGITTPGGHSGTPGASLTQTAWNVVGLLAVGTMVIGLALCIIPTGAPVPTPHPGKGIPLLILGGAAIGLSRFMTKYEWILDWVTGLTFVAAVGLLVYVVVSHWKQVKAQVASQLATGQPLGQLLSPGQILTDVERAVSGATGSPATNGSKGTPAAS